MEAAASSGVGDPEPCGEAADVAAEGLWVLPAAVSFWFPPQPVSRSAPEHTSDHPARCARIERE
ncbi:hypothetical protein EAE32_05935 [Kocuria tytonicola]|uniref:Uncharacterized protein n=1 Tax=Kocuria tytonicola TaxID=2055946 RepID=A0A3L9LCD9_9MICC|nr:hypothetical protein EAE32_05935 [Kocuria tytonicola]